MPWPLASLVCRKRNCPFKMEGTLKRKSFRVLMQQFVEVVEVSEITAVDSREKIACVEGTLRDASQDEQKLPFLRTTLDLSTLLKGCPRPTDTLWRMLTTSHVLFLQHPDLVGAVPYIPAIDSASCRLLCHAGPTAIYVNGIRAASRPDELPSVSIRVADVSSILDHKRPEKDRRLQEAVEEEEVEWFKAAADSSLAVGQIMKQFQGPLGALLRLLYQTHPSLFEVKEKMWKEMGSPPIVDVTEWQPRLCLLTGVAPPPGCLQRPILPEVKEDSLEHFILQEDYDKDGMPLVLFTHSTLWQAIPKDCR